MRLVLPVSGAWIELRDSVDTGDYYAVQSAVDLEITADPESGTTVTRLPGDHNLRRTDALLERVIVAWSFAEQGIPVPSQNLAGRDTVRSVVTDIDDFLALAAAVEPLLEKVNPRRRPNPRTSQPSSASSPAEDAGGHSRKGARSGS